MNSNFRKLRHQSRVFQLFFYENRYYPITIPNAFYKYIFPINDKKKLYVCLACKLYYSKEDDLKKHYTHCGDLHWEYQSEERLPAPNSYLKFKNHSNTLRHPFACYLDIESCFEDYDQTRGYQTHQYQKHVASTIGLLFVDKVRNTSEYSTFRSVSEFYDRIKIYLEYISSLDIPMSKEENQKGDLNTEKCSYCDKPFTKKNYPVKDHNHFSGKFRGIIHNNCNLKRQDKYFLPIIAHNMMGYDSHHLIRELRNINNTQRVQKDGIKIIAESLEKFVYFEARYQGKNGKIVYARFIDSLKFLDSSIDKLAKVLPEDQFRYSSHYFQDKKLFKRKGPFPYDLFTTESILDDTTIFPPEKDSFFNSLKNSSISSKKYNFFLQDCKDFDCKTLREYMEKYYLKLDVALLADIFEAFRDWNIEDFKLDPIYYVSLPALSLDNLLKFSNQKLELISDPEIYKFFEDAKRGGYCGIHKILGYANNINMKNYNSSLPSSYILYQDANNLYGWAMYQALPVSNFKLALPPENFDIYTCEDCFVEADFFLPKHLHKKFKDFPLFPEKIDGKLKATLYPKKKYKVHSRYLKLGLSLGYKLEKIHRVMSFESKPWIKSYIEKNTLGRMNAKSKFEEKLRKILVNSVYGKQIQDVRKETDVYMKNEKDLSKYIRDERFVSLLELSPDLFIIQMKKKKVELNKPIYGGATILDLSKMQMADYFYNVLKAAFQDRYELLISDTDSFMGLVLSENPYKELEPYFSNWIDTSSLSQYETINRLIPGMFKDEMKQYTILKFAGTRAKQYAYETNNYELYYDLDDDSEGEDQSLTTKSKGNNKLSMSKIVFKDYEDMILKRAKKPIFSKMRVIRSRNHIPYTETIDKKVLDFQDDGKRKILENNYDTAPHGYESN